MSEQRVTDIMEQVNKGRNVLADGPWKAYTDGLTGWERSTMAQLLENQAKHLAGLDEDVKTTAIASYEKFIFPMIRAVWPNLVSQELVSVQPMEGPISMLFFLDFTANAAKGSVAAGDAIITARTGMREEAQYYSSETVQGETIANTGSGPNNGTYTITNFAADYLPVRPGTMVFSLQQGDGERVTVSDDGAGGFVATGPANVTVTGGTLNYTSGAVANLVITNTGWTAGAVDDSSLSYSYNSEGGGAGGDTVPLLDATLTSTPVVSRPQKLRARWSAEVAAQLKAIHGLDAEVELTEALAQQIRFSIDNLIINDLYRISGAGSVTFDANPPVNVPYFTHQMSLIKTLQSGSNKIFKATRRGFGNWIVAGVDAATIFEAHPLFESSGNYNGPGVVFAGTLANKWKVFKNPFLTGSAGNEFTANKFLIGYKGQQFYDAGYVYGPWIPFFQTPTIILDDMMFRKGVMTHFGKKAVNGLFYATGTIVNP